MRDRRAQRLRWRRHAAAAPRALPPPPPRGAGSPAAMAEVARRAEGPRPGAGRRRADARGARRASPAARRPGSRVRMRTCSPVREVGSRRRSQAPARLPYARCATACRPRASLRKARAGSLDGALVGVGARRRPTRDARRQPQAGRSSRASKSTRCRGWPAARRPTPPAAAAPAARGTPAARAARRRTPSAPPPRAGRAPPPAPSLSRPTASRYCRRRRRRGPSCAPPTPPAPPRPAWRRASPVGDHASARGACQATGDCATPPATSSVARRRSPGRLPVDGSVHWRTRGRSFVSDCAKGCVGRLARHQHRAPGRSRWRLCRTSSPANPARARAVAADSTPCGISFFAAAATSTGAALAAPRRPRRSATDSRSSAAASTSRRPSAPRPRTWGCRWRQWPAAALRLEHRAAGFSTPPLPARFFRAQITARASASACCSSWPATGYDNYARRHAAPPARADRLAEFSSGARTCAACLGRGIQRRRRARRLPPRLFCCGLAAQRSQAVRVPACARHDGR